MRNRKRFVRNQIHFISNNTGQTTTEYALIILMLTECFLLYPFMMSAYDSYLNSLFFILDLALP
jgi:hypothetical protein